MDYEAYFKKHSRWVLTERMNTAVQTRKTLIDEIKKLEHVQGLGVGDILDVYSVDTDNRIVVSDYCGKQIPLLYVVVAKDDKTGATIASKILPKKKLSDPINTLNSFSSAYFKLNKRYVDELIVTSKSPNPFEFFEVAQARIKEVDKENKAKRLRFSINNNKLRKQVYERIPIGTNIYLEDYEAEEESNGLIYGKVVRIESYYDGDDWDNGGIIGIELSDGSREEFDTDDIAGPDAPKSIYLAEPTYY